MRNIFKRMGNWFKRLGNRMNNKVEAYNLRMIKKLEGSNYDKARNKCSKADNYLKETRKDYEEAGSL